MTVYYKPATQKASSCPGGCVLGIVGSRILAGRADADELIRREFEIHRPRWFVSGGADGIDKMAETEADSRGYRERKTIHLPEQRSWEYYKKRDKLIAQDSECLVCISGLLSRTQGAAWTASEAERLGKRVTRYGI